MSKSNITIKNGHSPPKILKNTVEGPTAPVSPTTKEQQGFDPYGRAMSWAEVAATSPGKWTQSDMVAVPANHVQAKSQVAQESAISTTATTASVPSSKKVVPPLGPSPSTVRPGRSSHSPAKTGAAMPNDRNQRVAATTSASKYTTPVELPINVGPSHVSHNVDPTDPSTSFRSPSVKPNSHEPVDRTSPNPISISQGIHGPVEGGSRVAAIASSLGYVYHENAEEFRVIGAATPATLFDDPIVVFGTQDNSGSNHWTLQTKGITADHCAIFVDRTSLLERLRVKFVVKSKHGRNIKFQYSTMGGICLVIGYKAKSQRFWFFPSAVDPLISNNYIIKRLVDGESWSVYLGALKSGGYNVKKPEGIRQVTIKVTPKDNINEAVVLKELAKAPWHYGKGYTLQTFEDNVDDADRAETVSLIDNTCGSLATHKNNPRWKVPHFFKKATFRIFGVIKFLHDNGVVHNNFTLENLLAYAPMDHPKFSIRLAHFDQAQLFQPKGTGTKQPYQGKGERLPFDAEPFRRETISAVNCVVEILLAQTTAEAGVAASEVSSTSLTYFENLAKAVTSEEKERKLLARFLYEALRPAGSADISSIMASEWFASLVNLKPREASKHNSDPAGNGKLTATIGAQTGAKSTSQRTTTVNAIETFPSNSHGGPATSSKSSQKKRKRPQQAAAHDNEEYVPPKTRTKAEPKAVAESSKILGKSG